MSVTLTAVRDVDLATHAFYLRSYLRPGGAPWRSAAPDPVPPDLLRPAARVLDAGCGPGRNSLALAAAGHEVVGLDLYPWVIRRARRAARARGLERRAHFVCAAATELVQAVGRGFDLVLDVLGPASDLPRAALPRYAAQLRAALAPGGAALVQTFLRPEELRALQDGFSMEVRARDPLSHWLVLRPCTSNQDG